jgi:hypothetical protein
MSGIAFIPREIVRLVTPRALSKRAGQSLFQLVELLQQGSRGAVFGPLQFKLRNLGFQLSNVFVWR